MVLEEDKTTHQKLLRAAYVARETGVSEGEAMTLIDLIGMDLSALLREARVLKKGQSGGAS